MDEVGRGTTVDRWPLPRRTKPARNTIDREQQRREVLLTLLVGGGGTEAPQQVHLLAADLIDGRETSRQAAPEPGESLSRLGPATHPKHGLHRSAILRLDQSEELIPRGLVRHQVGVESRDLEV